MRTYKNRIFIILIVLLTISMTGCSEKEAVYNPVPYIQYNEVKIVGKSNVKFEDSIEVEIIKPNEVFNKMEMTFQRD